MIDDAIIEKLEKLYEKGFLYGEGVCNKETIAINAIASSIAAIKQVFHEVVPKKSNKYNRELPESRTRYNEGYDDGNSNQSTHGTGGHMKKESYKLLQKLPFAEVGTVFERLSNGEWQQGCKTIRAGYKKGFLDQWHDDPDWFNSYVF